MSPACRAADLRTPVALLLGLLLSVSCTGRKSPPGPHSSWRERGIASWYGPGFHGKPTASGERYDMHDRTCAHRTLPFGTWIEVRRLDNGLRVRVRVNDRGPFIRGRIVDLSFGAAQALNLVSVGTAEVEIRTVGFEPPAGPTYSVQVGAFRERTNAKDLSEQLRSRGIPNRVESDELWHRVRVGRYARRLDAEAMAAQLSSQGYPATVVALR